MNTTYYKVRLTSAGVDAQRPVFVRFPPNIRQIRLQPVGSRGGFPGPLTTPLVGLSVNLAFRACFCLVTNSLIWKNLSLHSDKARPEGGQCLYFPTSLISLKHVLAEFRNLPGVCSQHTPTRVVRVFTFGQPLANGPSLSLLSDKPLKPWERVVLHSDKPNCLIWADLSLQFDNPTSGIVRGPGFPVRSACGLRPLLTPNLSELACGIHRGYRGSYCCVFGVHRPRMPSADAETSSAILVFDTHRFMHE